MVCADDKYNNNKNITFLTDSVEEDTKNLLNILNNLNTEEDNKMHLLFLGQME